MGTITFARKRRMLQGMVVGQEYQTHARLVPFLDSIDPICYWHRQLISD